MQLALAQNQYASGTMPGEQNMYQRADRSAADAIQSAREGGNALGYVSAVQANQSEAYRNIATASAQYNDAAQQRYSSMLGNIAQFKDFQFQMNQFSPYLDKYRESRDMIGAGEQNMFGGINNLAGLGAQYAMGRQAANLQQPLPAGVTNGTISGVAGQSAGQTDSLAATIAQMMSGLSKQANQGQYYINSIYRAL
jgi:hypothetical protein